MRVPTKRIYPVFILLTLLATSRAYGDYGIAPEITTNIRLNKQYSVTMKVESFHFLYTGLAGWGYDSDRTEAQLFANYRLGPFTRIAVGYMLGIEPEERDFHRAIQQVSVSQRLGSVTLSHRGRSEQTFYTDEPTKYRIRYRASFEVPLQGSSLDPREFYLVSSNEILFEIQKAEHEFENRFNFQLGYIFNSTYRLQSGVDFRYFFGDDENPYNLFFKIGCFINI